MTDKSSWNGVFCLLASVFCYEARAQCPAPYNNENCSGRRSHLQKELPREQAGSSILTAVWRRELSGFSYFQDNTSSVPVISRAGCKEGPATLKGAQGDVFSFTYSQDVMAGPSRCWHDFDLQLPCLEAGSIRC